MLRHLIIGPGPRNFEIHKYRLFLESVCVGKQEIGLVSDPFLKGHEIPPLFLKHGDDGMRMGNKNGVTSDDFRMLKPP